VIGFLGAVIEPVNRDADQIRGLRAGGDVATRSHRKLRCFGNRAGWSFEELARGGSGMLLVRSGSTRPVRGWGAVPGRRGVGVRSRRASTRFRGIGTTVADNEPGVLRPAARERHLA
jgi:hypothetical protein